MQRQQFTTDEPLDGFVTGDNTVTSLERDTTGGQLLSETASAAAEQSIEAEQSGVVEEAFEVGQSEEVGRVTAAIRREVRARHKRNVLFTVGSIVAYIPAFFFLKLIGTRPDLDVVRYHEVVAIRFLIYVGLPSLLLPLLMHTFGLTGAGFHALLTSIAIAIVLGALAWRETRSFKASRAIDSTTTQTP